jgi:catechol-2,3-dioxygenase
MEWNLKGSMNEITFKGLNHITLRVNNIGKAEQFYGEVLGFRVEKKMGRSMTVYRIGTDTLVLVEAETAYEKGTRDYRVDHFGFFVDTPEQVDQLAEQFREQEVTILSGPSNRKTGRFVFISDPDGNMIEICNEKS